MDAYLIWGNSFWIDMYIYFEFMYMLWCNLIYPIYYISGLIMNTLKTFFFK